MLGGWQTCLYSFPFPRQANSSSSPALPIWVTGVHLQCCLPPQEVVTLPDFCLCRVQSTHHETYFKQCWRREYSYFLQHDHQGEKKSTSIYPPICSRMEDKLFQFYRNECFMSCLCFPASVLNSYILLNAWMFSTKNAPWALRFRGFQFQNTRRGNAVIFLPFGDLSYLSFFFNQWKKKFTHYLMLRENCHYHLCVFPPISFSVHQKSLLPPPSICILFVLSHSVAMSVPNLYNHKKQGRDPADFYNYPCNVLFLSDFPIRSLVSMSNGIVSVLTCYSGLEEVNGFWI